MSTQYGIGVTKNRFELFDIDDEDPLEILKIHEEEKEARKKTKLSEKENKGKDIPKPKNSAPRKGIKETQNLKTHDLGKSKEETKPNAVQRGYERNDRKFVGDNREDRNNRRNRADSDFPRDDKGERQERKDGRGGVISGAGIGPASHSDTNDGGSGGRGGSGGIGSGGGGGMARPGGGRTGGPRGGGGGGALNRGAGGPLGGGTGGPGGLRQGGRGGNQNARGCSAYDVKGGKREFDRQMMDKNDLNGTVMLTQEESANRVQEKQESETVAETNGTTTTTTTEQIESGVNTQEEERKELTLDEWKAMKAPRQKPTYNLRKAGEGEDLSQWKKMYALQKKKDGEEDEDDDDYEYENCEYPQRVGRQKHILDIDIHFKDTRIGGRNRGGRGAGRGGSRMSGTRTSGPPGVHTFALSDKHTTRDYKSAPKVDDEHDFPSLG